MKNIVEKICTSLVAAIAFFAVSPLAAQAEFISVAQYEVWSQGKKFSTPIYKAGTNGESHVSSTYHRCDTRLINTNFDLMIEPEDTSVFILNISHSSLDVVSRIC